MTPNIRVLTGYWSENDLKSASIVIEKKANSTTFEKLERLPQTSSYERYFHHLMQACKKSLKSVSFAISKDTNRDDMATIGNSMGQFKNLTSINIVYGGVFRNLQELDLLLGRCYYVKELKLEIEETSTYAHMAKETLNTWLADKVQKVHTLKKLEISYMNYPEGFFGQRETQEPNRRNFGPDWIEYFIYKYPNIDELDIQNKTDEPYKHITLPDFRDMKLSVLGQWRFDTVSSLRDFIQRFKRSNISVLVIYDPPPFDRHVICEMSVSVAPNEVHFMVTIPREIHGEDRIMEVVSAIGHTSVDTLLVESAPDNRSQSLFSHLFDAFSPGYLKIKDMVITAEELLLDDMYISQLGRIKLKHTVSNPGCLTQLSRIAPNLKHLTLKNCNFQNQINVPLSHLHALTIHNDLDSNSMALYDEEEDLDLVSPQQIGGSIRGNLFFKLSCADALQQYIFAKVDGTVIMLSQKEFDMFSSDFNTIRIECKSLKYLTVDFLDVKFKLEFGKDGKAWLEGNPVGSTTLAPYEMMYSEAKKYLTDDQIQSIEKEPA